MTLLTILPATEQRRLLCAPYRIWAGPDGNAWVEFRHTPDGYSVRFPNLADFTISADGTRVDASAVPGVSSETLQHLYLNQIWPLSLNRQGRLVFHASAVALNEGAVAFLGVTGRGKSTLAAAFSKAGRRLFTDDALILSTSEASAGPHIVNPSHPSVRLWADSRRELMPDHTQIGIPVGYTSKERFMAGADLAFAHEPAPLKAAYFLGDGKAHTLAIEPLSAAQALLEWSANAFILDVDDKAAIRAQFERIAVLCETVPAFRLDYPRRFESLSAVVRSLSAHAGTAGRDVR